MPTNNELDAILKQRGSVYGDFRDNGRIAQGIKEVYRSHPLWGAVPPHIQEGLDLIATKISRIVSGDPLYPDNLIDIAGYATRCLQIVDEDRGTARPAHAGMTAPTGDGGTSPSTGDPIPSFLEKRTPAPKPDPRRRPILEEATDAEMELNRNLVKPVGAEEQ